MVIRGVEWMSAKPSLSLDCVARLDSPELRASFCRSYYGSGERPLNPR